jgi:hypothetical protein
MDTLSQVAAMPSAGTLPIIDADALRSLRESLAELHAHPDLAQRARVRVMYRQAIGSVRSHIDLVQRGTLPDEQKKRIISELTELRASMEGLGKTEGFFESTAADIGAVGATIAGNGQEMLKSGAQYLQTPEGRTAIRTGLMAGGIYGLYGLVTGGIRRGFRNFFVGFLGAGLLRLGFDRFWPSLRTAVENFQQNRKKEQAEAAKKSVDAKAKAEAEAKAKVNGPVS